jgi:hypothetical protein
MTQTAIATPGSRQIDSQKESVIQSRGALSKLSPNLALQPQCGAAGEVHAGH